MLIDGSIDTPYSQTSIDGMTDASIKSEWSIQKFMNAVTGTTNATQITSDNILWAYNTTTNPELKLFLRLLVDINEHGFATGVSDNFNILVNKYASDRHANISSTDLINLIKELSGTTETITTLSNINPENWFCVDWS